MFEKINTMLKKYLTRARISIFGAASMCVQEEGLQPEKDYWASNSLPMVFGFKFYVLLLYYHLLSL